VFSLERIRQLQPGIVVNPRFHGHGDFKTYERKLTTTKVAKGWAEFCNTWTDSWPHVKDAPFRAPGFQLTQLVTSRALGVNYLLGVGPTSDGEFVEDIYQNMAVVEGWMKRNGPAVKAAPLPAEESASVPATAAGETRYLFAVPAFTEGGRFDKDQLPAADVELTLKGVAKPRAVRLLSGGPPLKYSYADQALTVALPAARRTKLVDVVRIDLPAAKRAPAAKPR
jgi:alpha-L-fucosidase